MKFNPHPCDYQIHNKTSPAGYYQAVNATKYYFPFSNILTGIDPFNNDLKVTASAAVPSYKPKCIGIASFAWTSFAACAASFTELKVYVWPRGNRAISAVKVFISGISSVSPAW